MENINKNHETKYRKLYIYNIENKQKQISR